MSPSLFAFFVGPEILQIGLGCRYVHPESFYIMTRKEAIENCGSSVNKSHSRAGIKEKLLS